MTQRSYDKEFKLSSVKLYLANKGKKGIREVADDLGIPYHTLGNWVTHYNKNGEGSFVGSGNTRDQELRDLKKELHIVKQERDILKKAVAIFSTPQSKSTNL